MDTVTILLSLIKEGWLLLYYPSSQTMSYFNQTEPRLRINPNRVTAIESHTESLGKAYHSLYALSQEANLVRDAVCKCEALATPKSEIAPELRNLIEQDEFDGTALLLACVTQGWINIEYDSEDHYLVEIDVSIARGIPYIFNQVATMLQAMRKALKQTKAFEMTCKLFTSNQTPSSVQTVPGAQVHHTKITVLPNITLTTRSFEPVDNAAGNEEQASQPTAQQPEGPAESERPRTRSEYSFEEVLQDKILVQLRTADKGLSIVALQNRLSRFFRQEIEDCLDKLTEDGSIEKSDSIHYMTAEAVEKQRAKQRAKTERMAAMTPAAESHATGNESPAEDESPAKQQPVKTPHKPSTVAPKPVATAPSAKPAEAPKPAATAPSVKAVEAPKPTETPKINALEPFHFNTLEGAVLFLRAIGMDRLPICNVLDIPSNKYLDYLDKGYEVANNPEQYSEQAREDVQNALKAQSLRRSEMRLLIQYFTGKIVYERGNIHSRDCYQNNEALDRIFDRFNLFNNSSAAKEATETADSQHAESEQPAKDNPAGNIPPSVAIGRATLAEHPRYPIAPKGSIACEGAGTALPLDYWPYPFAQIEHRVLFLHLLGANRADIRTALGIPLQRVDDLMDAACKHTPIVRGAVVRTARGRLRVKPELVNLTGVRMQGDPMGFALSLPARCKSYMVGWLLGEHNLQIADRARVGLSTLKKLQQSILEEFQRWNEARAVDTTEMARKNVASPTTTGREPAQNPSSNAASRARARLTRESTPVQQPAPSAASKPASSTPQRSAVATPQKQHHVVPGHLAPKPTPFPPLPEYPVAIGRQLSEPLPGQALPLEYWPYPFLSEKDQALFLRLLGANITEISNALGISFNAATNMVKEGCRQHLHIHRATTFHDWGGVTIDASRVDIKKLREKADPMGFPCSLMRVQRSFLLHWIMGADDAKLAQVAQIAPHQVLSFHKNINAAQHSWIQASAKSTGSSEDKRARASMSAQAPAMHPKVAATEPSAFSDPAQQVPVQEPLPITDAPAAKKRPTFDEWVRTLDDFTSKAVIAKIEDNGFSNLAKETGTSIRQCRLAYMEARAHQPRLQEDEYLHLVETYNITKERFIQLTGLSGQSFLYLCRMRSQKGVRPLMPNGLNDPGLPAEFRERLEKSNQNSSKNNSVLIDGTAVPKRFEALITQLGKYLTSQKPITIAQFQIEYQQLLEKNGLERQPLLAAADNPQTFSQEIAHTGRFLIPSQKHVRYYDFDAHDFAPIATMLRKESSRDIECSARLLFDTHRALMDQLDLKTEEELFVVIKRVVSEHRIPNVTVLKNPILQLGKANRHQQILGIIQELSPANSDEIASAYQERYGVAANTVKSSYLRDFQAYRKHGIYEYRDTSLTDAQRDYLASLLTDDYHALSSIKMRYEAAPFSPSGLDINDENLESLGYVTSHGLVVRKDIDLRALFGERLDSHERFCEGDSGFEEAVMRHPAFRSELFSRISLYQIVQFEPGKYISSKKLADIFGISPSMLSNYARSVARTATPEVPFTVESLRRSGFSDPVDILREDADFKDCFYETLIESLPATELIKRTSLDGTKVYCKSKTPLSSSTFIKHIVQREGEIEIEDLLYLLEDEYGIKTTINVLRGIVERAYQANYIFYNQQFETLLPDKAANAEFLRRCINGNK